MKDNIDEEEAEEFAKSFYFEDGKEPEGSSAGKELVLVLGWTKPNPQKQHTERARSTWLVPLSMVC